MGANILIMLRTIMLTVHHASAVYYPTDLLYTKGIIVNKTHQQHFTAFFIYQNHITTDKYNGNY